MPTFVVTHQAPIEGQWSEVSLVPYLLGGGVRLFDNLGAEPIGLEQTSVIESSGVTHIGIGCGTADAGRRGQEPEFWFGLDLKR